MFHRNARLTPTGRRILVERVLAGRPIAHVAKEMGISRTCAHRWTCLCAAAPAPGRSPGFWPVPACRHAAPVGPGPGDRGTDPGFPGH